MGTERAVGVLAHWFLAHWVSLVECEDQREGEVRLVYLSLWLPACRVTKGWLHTLTWSHKLCQVALSSQLPLSFGFVRSGDNGHPRLLALGTALSLWLPYILPTAL